MDNKNYKEIAKQILDKEDMEPLNIKVHPKHLKHIEGVAERMDLSITEAATFLMYAYINDVMLTTQIEMAKKFNPN